MCNDETAENLSERELLQAGGKSFGWSSPWPEPEDQSYVIEDVDVSNGTAVILYYYDGALYEPEHATRILLNLSDEVQVSVTDRTKAECFVELHFPESDTDVRIRVVQAGDPGQGEIWIPQECSFVNSTETTGRNIEQAMNALKVPQKDRQMYASKIGK